MASNGLISSRPVRENTTSRLDGFTITDPVGRRNGHVMNDPSNSNRSDDRRQVETAAEMPRRVGLIGLGLVGKALAGRLLKAGFEVVGHDISAEAVRAFAEAGGEPAADAAEAARGMGIVLLSLPDGQAVRLVTDTILPEIGHGAVVIDTTTAAPDEVEATAAKLASVGAEYLDATLSGSSEVIAAGQATWLAGGSAGALAAAGPVFEAIGGAVHHLGPTGAGTRAKLVSNLILGLNRAALAEGLALAEAWGMEMASTLEALRASAAYSKVMDAKGAKMITGDYAPQARLKQHHKDVRLILESAGIDLPLSALHDELLNRAESAGWGDADNSSIIEVWRARKPSKS